MQYQPRTQSLLTLTAKINPFSPRKKFGGPQVQASRKPFRLCDFNQQQILDPLFFSFLATGEILYCKLGEERERGFA